MTADPASVAPTANRPAVGAERRSRLGVAAASVIASGVLSLIVITAVLHLINGGTDLTTWWFGNIAVAASLVIPGALVAAKRPRNVIGWLLLISAASVALPGAGREYLVHGVLGGTAPGYLTIGWITNSVYFISMSMLPLVLMVFPDGRVFAHWARSLTSIPVLSMVFATFGDLFSADETGTEIHGYRLYNPGRNVFPDWIADLASTLSWMLYMASVILAIVMVALRYHRSDAEVRLQMKWVVWAGSIELLEVASEWIPGNEWSPYTSAVTSALMSTSVCVAILRRRLFDIDLVINRTLVYALLSAGVIGLYIAVVAAVDSVVGEHVQIGSGLVVVAIVAFAFGPARSRLQKGVDRLMYGERRNPYGVISRLGKQLEDARGVDELAVAVSTVAQTLKLPYAAITDPYGLRLTEYGVAPGPLVTVPLPYQGASMGQLLVSPRHSQANFNRDEQQLLADLARQIGAVIHAVRLSADLQASRTRLVNAKEEERRRLRRDLHDGLGPKLAALGLKVDAAQALADDRPEDSKQLMTTIKDDIRSTIEDIRHLVYDLRPPALDELGLIGAIRESAGRFDDSASTEQAAPAFTPRITISAPDRLPPLPAAVEVAAYRIVTEALTNAVRHARPRNCAVEVTVSEDGSTLRVCIDDDGDGLPGGWRPGVGISSMRERAEELGGRLTLRAGPSIHGTQVQAHLPCRSEQ